MIGGDFSPQDPIWVRPELIFDGQSLLTGRILQISGRRITHIADEKDRPHDVTVHSLAGLVTPGFFDIQVNGGGGVLFNTDQSCDGLATIAGAHRQFGTTGILPTLITDRPDILDAACDAILDCAGTPGIMGFHIEGPHIGPSRAGTHAPEFIRPLDRRTMECVRRLRQYGVATLITLAPESVSAGQVADLCDLGAVVSVGHSGATSAQVQSVLNEGAQLFTHLFNAMSPMENREPGVTGAAINSSVYCSVICDGIHVSGDMIALAARARPVSDRMIIVSDAMPTVGGPDSFQLYGRSIRVSNGRLINANGSLAGAHTTMLQSIAYLRNFLGFDLQETLRMAISNPARLMGLSEHFGILGDTANCLHIPGAFSDQADLPDCLSLDQALGRIR